MRRTAAAAILVWVLASCASGPELPLGIGEPSWPTDAEGWAAVFDAMPGEAGGLARQEGGILGATYGDTTSQGWIRTYADDLGAAECPGLFGTSLLRSILEEDGDLVVEESSPDGAGDPSYLFGSRPDGTELAAWTVPECRWVVVVEAPTEALRDAGVEAVVAAGG